MDSDRPAQIVSVMDGVREYSDGLPVELWRLDTGRLVICAKNEGGFAGTAIDLGDLVDWLRHGGSLEELADGQSGFAVKFRPSGNK